MIRLSVVLLAAAGLGLTPGAAAAKQFSKATVCGADGCTTQSSDSQRSVIATAVENGGPPASPPKRHAPFYRVRVYMKSEGPTEPPFRLVVVPSLRLVASADNRWPRWTTMDRFAYSAWRKAVRGIRPYPAAKLPGVQLPSSRQPVTSPQAPRTRAPALHPSAGHTDWGLIAGIASGALALAAAIALVVRRRRPEPSGTPPAAEVF